MCGIVAYIGPNNAIPILFEACNGSSTGRYDSAGVAVTGRCASRCTNVCRPGRRAWLRSRRRSSCAEISASGTPGGQPMASRRRSMPTPRRTSRGRWPWCTTESSRTPPSCGPPPRPRCLSLRDRQRGASAPDRALVRAGARRGRRRGAGGGRGGLRDRRHRSAPTRPASWRRATGARWCSASAKNEHFVASDAGALVRHTEQVVYLDDGEIWPCSSAIGSAPCSIEAGQRTKGSRDRQTRARGATRRAAMRRTSCTRRSSSSLAVSADVVGAARAALRQGAPGRHRAEPPARRSDPAGQGPRVWFRVLRRPGRRSSDREHRPGIPADAEPASEFRYRNPVIEPDTLYVAVSQSGETYDTLAAVREIKRKGGPGIGVVNEVGSSIGRECETGHLPPAGMEVSVTSTKSSTSPWSPSPSCASTSGASGTIGQGDGSLAIGVARGAAHSGIEETLGEGKARVADRRSVLGWLRGSQAPSS